jgi:hypothetical protein
MPDQRLPITIKQLPGGFAIHFADGRRAFIIYVRDETVARAADSFTMDEARELAQDVARAFTDAWSRDAAT